MSDSIGTILSKGWNDLKTNLVLLVPSLLETVLAFVFLFLLVVGLFGSVLFDLSDFGFSMVLILLLFVFFVVYYCILLPFFKAGLIGMAKEAVQNGETKLEDLWSYGKKYLFKMFLLNVLIFILAILLMFLLLALLIPFIIIIGAIGFSSSSLASILISFLFILFFILIATVSLIAFILFTYFASYALVLNNLGVIESLEMSFRLFMNNKTSVFLFVFVLFMINFIFSIIIRILYIFSTILFDLSPIVGLILMILLYIIEIIVALVLTGLVAVWSVRKYYDLTEEQIDEKNKESGKYFQTEQNISDSEENIISEKIIMETDIEQNEEEKE